MNRQYVVIFLLILGCGYANANPAIDSMYGVGASYFKKGDYAGNLKIMTAVLKTAEQSGNCTDIASAMTKVGSAYYFLQQKRVCQEWMLKARKKAFACNIDSLKWKTDRQIGAVYFEYAQADSALIYLREAERLLKNKNDWAEKSALYAVIGETYVIYLKDTSGAKYYFDNCVVFADNSKDTIRRAYAAMQMGQYLGWTKQFDAALQQFTKALELYRAAHLPEGIMYALNCQAWMLSELGRAKEVFKTMAQRNYIRDSIFKEETAQKTAEYRTLYETEKKERQNQELAKDNALKKLQIAEAARNRRLLTVVFVSGIIILAILFLFFYNRYKLRKEAEMDRKLLEQQKLRFKAVMEAEEKERVRIARELHDSLGQMLSAAKMNMSAMDSYNEEDAKLMNNARRLVDDSVKEVRSISHNLMPASLMDKGIVTALNELANKINDTGLLHIELTISSSETRLDSSVEIAIYRIVQEVVNNMIKHSKANTVEILLDYDGDKIYLSIKDNGVGFDTATIEQSSGIGWKNIFSRVYMMNGDVQIDSQPGRGTLVNIEFSK